MIYLESCRDVGKCIYHGNRDVTICKICDEENGHHLKIYYKGDIYADPTMDVDQIEPDCSLTTIGADYCCTGCPNSIWDQDNFYWAQSCLDCKEIYDCVRKLKQYEAGDIYLCLRKAPRGCTYDYDDFYLKGTLPIDASHIDDLNCNQDTCEKQHDVDHPLLP